MNVQGKEPPGKRLAPTAARRTMAPPAAIAALPPGLAILKSPDVDRVRPVQFLALQTYVGNKAVAQVASRAAYSRGSRPAHNPARPRSPKRPINVMRRPAVRAFLQRAVACPPAPTAPQPVAPTEDPRFTKVTDDVSDASRKEKAHPSAKTKVAEAQGAAAGPPNEVTALAGANQVDKMGAAKPGTFDKAAFIAAVGKAIDAAAPKNPEEATEFKGSGKTAEVKQQVSGLVTKGKDGSAQEIKTATTAPPDASGAKPKPVTPMAPESPGPAPGPVAGDQAMPAPRGPDQTELGAGPCAINNKLADAEVTDDQLKKGNEPQFNDALDSKQKAEEHAAQAPPDAKAAEGAQLGQAQAGAAGTVAAGLTAMHGGRASALGGISAHKSQAKAADEAKRAEISKHIEQVFTKTKTDVGALLDGLDQQVTDVFDKGEKVARDTFDTNVGKEVDDWKDERYSGLRGKWRWVKDKFAGLPAEVNQIYTRNRTVYLANMQKVISDVADVVGSTLGKAKQRIADGRNEIKAYVASQPAALRKFANEAGEKMSEQFDSLDSDVDSKQESVVSDLAQKYVAARQSVDDSITKMQEDNKGLVEKAVDAVEAVVGIILKMKDMLMNVLSRAANAIGRIISDPIGFLDKLVSAVKAGLSKFVANIGEHLKKGLLDWLLGALSSAGIELPETFDLKGILTLALSILGLTWANIRGRLVSQVGEPVMAKMEQAVDVFKIIATEGLAGLWKWILDRVGDFQEMVMGEIREFISEKVIKAGIEWLIGILNPAAAFIKACEAIYNVVMFFVEKGKEIIEFVNSILDSVESILNGGVGAVADLIEGTLAKTVPLIINFLADLLGLGGISEKIKEVIGKIQAPVNKAIDAVIGGALKIGKKLFGGLIAKGKGLYAKGATYVKGKVEAGKALVKSGVDAAMGPGRQKDQGTLRPQAVKQEARRQLQPGLGNIGSTEDLRALLTAVMADLRPRGLHRLNIVSTPTEGTFEVHAEASAGEPVGKVTPNFSLDLADIDVTTARNQFVTVARGFIDGRDIGTGRNNTPVAADADLETVEQQGRHAETSVLDQLNNMVMLERYPTTGQHRLELYVTRTPCNACTTRIDGIRRLFEARGGSLDIDVRSLALYQGSRDAARNEETGRGTRAGGTYSLRRLQQMGVRVEVWDLQRDARRLFGPGVDMAQVTAVAGRLNGKVQQLQAVINSMPLIDIM